MLKRKSVKRKNPEVSDKNLIKILEDLGEEFAFSYNYYRDMNFADIWPHVPELAKWENEYPVLEIKFGILTKKNKSKIIKISYLLDSETNAGFNSYSDVIDEMEKSTTNRDSMKYSIAFMRAEEFLKSKKQLVFSGNHHLKKYNLLKQVIKE